MNYKHDKFHSRHTRLATRRRLEVAKYVAGSQKRHTAGVAGVAGAMGKNG